MKKILLSIFLSSICLLGMSQKSQIDLPITWDDTTNVDYSVIGFGMDTAYLAADPTNASNIVLEVIKPIGAQTWAGVVLGNDSLASTIPFSMGNTIIRARIYSPTAGTPMRMKVENEANAAIFVEAEVNTTVVGWDTLSFDFSSQVAGTPAINFSNVYDKIAVFFNFGVSPTVAETYHIDYVEFTGGGSTGPSKAQIDLPINWDDTANVNYAIIDFGGNVSSLVADPTNASNLVLKSDKPSSAQTWAGTTLGNSLATAIPFTATGTIMQARIWSAASGIPVLMKVEDQTNPAIFVETLANTSRVGWDTLTFDFSNPAPNNQAINLANTYDKVSLFFNFNIVPAATETYYTDDVWFGSGSVTGPAKAQIDLPINWDDTTNVDYTIIDFGGNVSSVVVDPTNASNLVLKSDKPSNAQTWAGTTLGNSLATAIPFTATSTIMQARVWSAASGIPVLMKVEDQTNPAIFVETLANTSRVGWDTLTFDFSNPGPNTQALNLANTYDKVSLFFNFNVVPAATETYYTDNVWFGLGSVTGPTKAQIDLPINWDDTTTVDYTITDFGGNVSSVVADPTNPSNLVLKSDKPSNAQTWAGTTLGNSLATAIPFTATSTVMQARVWSAASGIPVLMKVEDQTNAAIFVETLANTSKVGWDTLTFDFSNPGPNTQAINLANTYDRVSLFFNFNVVPAATETYYTDDVSFGPLSTGLNSIFSKNNTLNLFPNPARNFIQIDDNALANENVTIEIYNSIGQTVYSSNEVFNASNRIDVSELENGLYIISIQSNEVRKTSKLFISK